MQGSFLSLCFCLHDYPKPGCPFPSFLTGKLLLILQYLTLTLPLHSWIESLSPWISYDTLFLALETMPYSVSSLLASVLPIRLYAPWGQEPSLVSLYRTPCLPQSLEKWQGLFGRVLLLERVGFKSWLTTYELDGHGQVTSSVKALISWSVKWE